MHAKNTSFPFAREGGRKPNVASTFLQRRAADSKSEGRYGKEGKRKFEKIPQKPFSQREREMLRRIPSPPTNCGADFDPRREEGESSFAGNCAFQNRFNTLAAGEEREEKEDWILQQGNSTPFFCHACYYSPCIHILPRISADRAVAKKILQTHFRHPF